MFRMHVLHRKRFLRLHSTLLKSLNYYNTELKTTCACMLSFDSHFACPFTYPIKNAVLFQLNVQVLFFIN